MFSFNRSHNFSRISAIDMIMTYFSHWSGVAATHAWRVNYTHFSGVCSRLYGCLKLNGTSQLTTEAVTNPDSDCRRRQFPFFNNVKMRIKSGTLIDFSHGDIHFVSQGCKMCGRQVTKVILNQMQVLNQHVTFNRLVTH